jgi:hypothetical protein
MFRYLLGRVEPVEGQWDARANAAVDWLLRAQGATPDDGVSLGYFPCEKGGAWLPSYPETTGYIISTLLKYASEYSEPKVREQALLMARWEISIQMASGAVQGGPVCSPQQQTPTAFNTGMVVDGWCSAYAETEDRVILAAAQRAADFLIGDIGPEGYFRTNGAFVKPDLIKTYNCLCAWALHRFADCSGSDKYREAAIRVTEAAIRRQSPTGWFADNCLTHPEAPLLHTIGYTLQGILEVGLSARRDDLVTAALRGLDPLLTRLSPKGFLHGRFYSDWSPAVFSACLTGLAQIAVVCFRAHEHTGVSQYRRAGNCITDFLKSLQELDCADNGVNGALAGSFPMLGSYMMLGYPNWATKYLLDALMLQRKHHNPPRSAAQQMNESASVQPMK